MNTGSYAEILADFQRMSTENWQNSLNLFHTQLDSMFNQVAAETAWGTTENLKPVKKWQDFAIQQMKRTVTVADSILSSCRGLWYQSSKTAPTQKAKTVKKKQTVNTRQKKEK